MNTCPSCQNPLEEEGQRFCRACGAQIPDAPPDPLIGQMVGGKFKVLKILGEGGMGCVYKGEQNLGTKNRNVAIKTLHAQYSHDPKVMARFERECGTMAGLEHPNTIQVYDFGKMPDGQLYIVMEFVKGKSLADTLAETGPMPPERVDHIMGQICGSLEEAHAAGIVHRDLKPDNVVLTERAGKKDFVKVLDFGIAKQSGEQDKAEQKLTQQGMVLGTPPYMSPEQFTGKPIDARSDIYSLAVMAYEMLTSRLPFEAETAFEWATKHMTAQPTPLEVTPQGLAAPDKMKAAIMRGLEKNPNARFGNVREFFEAFTIGASAATFGAVRGGTQAIASQRAPAVSVQTGQGPMSGRGPTEATPAISAPGFGGPQQQSGGTSAMVPPNVAHPSAPPQPMMAPQGYGPPPQQAQAAYGTPPQGNVAFPTPPMQPQVAQPSGGGGGGKIFAIVGLLVVVVAVLGIGGFFVVKSREGGHAATTSTSTTSATSTTTSTDTTATTTTAGNDTPDAADKSSDAGKDAAPAKDAAAPHPTTTTTTTATVPKPQPVSCAQAGQMLAIHHMKEYEFFANKCRQEGGTPP